MSKRPRARCDRGQASVEWVGLFLVVGVLMGAVAVSGIGGDIGKKITCVIVDSACPAQGHRASNTVAATKSLDASDTFGDGSSFSPRLAAFNAATMAKSWIPEGGTARLERVWNPVIILSFRALPMLLMTGASSSASKLNGLIHIQNTSYWDASSVPKGVGISLLLQEVATRNTVAPYNHPDCQATISCKVRLEPGRRDRSVVAEIGEQTLKAPGATKLTKFALTGGLLYDGEIGLPIDSRSTPYKWVKGRTIHS